MSKLNSTHNRAVWFDIFVDDLERAAKFYGKVLEIPIHRAKFGDTEFCVLDHQEGNGGCLVPRMGGGIAGTPILLYLNVNGRIREAVQQAEAYGGAVMKDVHSIEPHGFRAVIRDSEGNEIALHSETDA